MLPPSFSILLWPLATLTRNEVVFPFGLHVVESPLLNAENPQHLLTLVETDGTQHSVKEHAGSCLLVKDVEGKWLCGCEHVHREKKRSSCVREKRMTEEKSCVCVIGGD